MRCTRCGADNREGAKFCSECATPFSGNCPRCGAANKPNAKFCDECAASLGRPPAIPLSAQAVRVTPEQPESAGIEGARKGGTALFAEIKALLIVFAATDAAHVCAI